MSEQSKLARHKTVREALQYVADNPETTRDPIDTPVWELIARILYDIANSPDARVRGSMARATRAQAMISDRMVGTRRAGTHPAQARKQTVMLKDLTGAIGR